MWDLPNLDKLEAMSTYTDIFMYTFLWNIGLYGMGLFLLFILFLIVKLYNIHKRRQIHISRESLLTYQEGARDSQRTETENRESAVAITDSQATLNEAEQTKKVNMTCFDFISYMTSLFFYLTLLSISAIYLGFYVFGKLGRGTGHDVLAVLIMICIVVLPTILWKYQTRPQNKKIKQCELIFTIVTLLLWVGLATFAVISMKGVCICVFNDKYGIKFREVFSFSTQFSRSLQIDKVCPDSKVCHMYATLPENASDSVFINVHTGTNVENLTVSLEKVSTEEDPTTQFFQLINSKPIRMNNIEYIARRNVYSFLFEQLTPDTLYTVVAKDANNVILYRTNYRTLPGDNATELRMAVGGDVGLDRDASKLTGYLSGFDPHVLLIGGDNAYDDGMRTCFYSWDNFFDIMDELNGQLNRMVPMVLSVGNHDVGYNALAGIKIDFNKEDDLPYYFLFHPQHRLQGNGDLPDPKNRVSYHYHVIGPTVQMHLDSGYVANFSSQKAIIESVTNKFPNHLKFANYHNPIYPSCTNNNEGSNDRLVIAEGLKHWTPLFDAGKFVAAFEHHTHHRKFTFKIKDNKPQLDTAEGVRYVGDGSWGVPEERCPVDRGTPYPDNFQYYEREHPNHIWKIRLFKKPGKTYSVEYVAIDINNTVVFNATDDPL